MSNWLRQWSVRQEPGSARRGGLAECRLEPLREAFERSGLTKCELARRLGWLKPDTHQVNRALGYRGYHDGYRNRPPRETTSYENALRLAEAMGVDPVDVGL